MSQAADYTLLAEVKPVDDESEPMAYLIATPIQLSDSQRQDLETIVQGLDILLPTHRDKPAAKRFFKKWLKGLRYVLRVVVTDKLRSYGAALKEIMPSIEHGQPKGLNNRAELSHQPTRQQERQRRWFKSAGQAQRFFSAHAPVNNGFW